MVIRPLCRLATLVHLHEEKFVKTRTSEGQIRLSHSNKAYVQKKRLEGLALQHHKVSRCWQGWNL